MTEGKVVFNGQDITSLSSGDLRAIRREVQIVFQDPYGSLNPRRRIGAIVGEPLAIHGLERGSRRRERVQELMAMVGLNPEHYNRYPAEFSGGQRQRAGIARALAVNPKLLICDEPVSALDVSVQAQVINLLKDLQAKLNLTCIFISHDLGVVEHVSDRVAVMYLGKVVELASAGALYREPRHPYAAALLSAASVTDPDLARQRRRLTIEGDIPSPIDPPHGCRFHPRCPRAQDRCRVEEPVLEPSASDPGHVSQSYEAWRRFMTLAIRTRDAAPGLVEEVKKQIWSVDSQIPVSDVHTMDELLAASFAQQRFNVLLLGLFAMLALILAAVGIYGAMAYGVNQRTHEIGIRTALGAQRSDVLRLVMKDGTKIALFGIASGIAGALALKLDGQSAF